MGLLLTVLVAVVVLSVWCLGGQGKSDFVSANLLDGVSEGALSDLVFTEALFQKANKGGNTRHLHMVIQNLGGGSVVQDFSITGQCKDSSNDLSFVRFPNILLGRNLDSGESISVEKSFHAPELRNKQCEFVLSIDPCDDRLCENKLEESNYDNNTLTIPLPLE